MFGGLASNRAATKNKTLRTPRRSGFRLHDKQKDFLHVAGHILSGRTDEQKSEISHALMAELKTQFKQCICVSCNS